MKALSRVKDYIGINSPSSKEQRNRRMY